MRSDLNNLKTRTVSLERYHRVLLQQSDGYMNIRRHFIDVYKRKQGLNSNQRIIIDGNDAANEGDVVGDAMMYDLDQRTDRVIFRQLYGLDVAEVIEFGTLLVLIRSRVLICLKWKRLQFMAAFLAS